MNTPNYEGKVCKAVVRLLEKRTGESRTNVRFPEKDRCGPPVDLRVTLGTQEYAIEHTRIEAFESQIKTALVFNEIRDYINEWLITPLPGAAYYALHVPNDVSLPEKKEKRTQALNNLVEWIQTSAQCLYERNSGRIRPVFSPHVSDDHVKGRPKGFNCVIELLRWPNAALIRRIPGSLGMGLFCPKDFSDLDDRRSDRLRRAFSKKLPKLQECKALGMRTVLVLENRDSVLTRFDQLGNGLPELLAEHTSDAPDEIYLVESGTDLWWVYLIKRDDEHWPKVGMPRCGQSIYEPGTSPTDGLPKWYRDALQLDEVYTPHPAEWCPATFNETELNDLKSDHTSKAL